MKYLSFLAIAGVLLGASPVFAAAGTHQPTWSQDRCENGLTRLSDRMAQSADRFSKREANYDDRLSRLESLADEADAAGLDSSDLRTDITTLEGLYNTLEADRDAFIAHQNDVLALDCGALVHDDINALRSEGKSLRTQVRTDAKALRTFVHDTLRPDVKELNASLK